MGTESKDRPRGEKGVGAAPPIEKRRIPLPPLSALRTSGGKVTRSEDPKPSPAAEGGRGDRDTGLSDAETDMLLDTTGSGRPGLPGAEVLNELVEEIEKDLDVEAHRHVSAVASSLPEYGRSMACSFAPDEQEGETPPGRTGDEGR